MASEQQVFPIERDGVLLGTVSLAQVRQLPRDLWLSTTVDQIMLPRAQLPALPPDAGAERAFVELARSDVDQLVILEGPRLLGLVGREDLLRWLNIHEWMMATES